MEQDEAKELPMTLEVASNPVIDYVRAYMEYKQKMKALTEEFRSIEASFTEIRKLNVALVKKTITQVINDVKLKGEYVDMDEFYNLVEDNSEINQKINWIMNYEDD